MEECCIEHSRREAIFQDHHPAGASGPILIAVYRNPVARKFERDILDFAKVAMFLKILVQQCLSAV
jgi:hypothetical protein